MNQLSNIFRKIDLFSLRARLTIGVAVFSTLGLGILAIWTNWTMQQFLIDSHKQNIEDISNVCHVTWKCTANCYRRKQHCKMRSTTCLTPRRYYGSKVRIKKIIARSNNFHRLPNSTINQLISLTEMPIKPQIYEINQQYFILRGLSLPIQGKIVGKLFLVQDVTRDQTMFLAMVWRLGTASIVVIIVMVAALTFYIHRSLRPLRQISQMTEVISAEDLGQARLYLDNAPSEVRELAQTLNTMLSRLSQSWEKERQFFSNVSHELRTPLTIIHGYLQSVLRRQHLLTEVQREALETAASEAERTVRLLQDLLDVARADSGYLYFNIQSCSLNDLAAEVVEMAGQYSDRTITIESFTYPIQVKADYNRLKQVLLNLIDNAIKYSDRGTSIKLKLSHQGDEGIIQVFDKGYGIPLQHQSRIFERFYRVDEARNRSTGGSGLGLSIVKTLVEAMGGSVTVRSKLGEGSVFTVILPA